MPGFINIGNELIFMLCHSHLFRLTCDIICNDSFKYMSKVCSEIPLHHSVFLLERMCCMTTVKWYPVLSVIIYLHKQPLMLGSLRGVGLWVIRLGELLKMAIQFIQTLGRSEEHPISQWDLSCHRKTGKHNETHLSRMGTKKFYSRCL